jgi:hypothetical protein
MAAAAVTLAAGTAARGAPTATRAPSTPPDPVVIYPDAVHIGSALSSPPSTSRCEKSLGIACYEPAQIQQAYDLRPLFRAGTDGKGQTIVVVDSFGSPTIGHDLTIFDRAFKLPAPPSFTVIQPAGAVPPYEASADREGWAGEATLDVEWAHTMAPGASILLVETPTSEVEGTSGFPQIVAAELYVIKHHLGGVISQSFSATEQTFPTAQALLALRTAYIAAAQSTNNVTVLAASGDFGAADLGPDNSTFYDFPVTSWPDSDPLVTGVGGTQLHLDAAGNRTSPDTVWNDTYDGATNSYFAGSGDPNPLASGGGKSIIFERPTYQNGVARIVGQHRGVPDVSMSAACDGAVDAYQSFAGQTSGWYPVCGTSVATPLFAGIVALADQEAGHPLGLINPALYALSASRAAGIVDITQGNNTVSFTQDGKLQKVRGFPALRGYDLASGVGTIDAAKFVPELVKLAARFGLGPPHDRRFVYDRDGLDVDETRLVEHRGPCGHRDRPLLEPDQVTTAVLDDPPPTSGTLAKEQGQLRTDDLTVAGVAPASEHHVAYHEHAARAQPLERLVDSGLLVPVSQMVQGVVRDHEIHGALRQSQALDRHGASFDVRDALPLGVLEQQGDHLLAHVDPDHGPAALGKSERHLSRSAAEVDGEGLRRRVSLAQYALYDLEETRIVTGTMVPTRRPAGPETSLARDVPIGTRRRLAAGAHELVGLKL